MAEWKKLVVSGSNISQLNNDTGYLTQLPSGVVSGSSQVSYTGLSNIPAGIVSGAAQIVPLLPTGTVSGSSQVVGILSSLNSYTSSNDAKFTTLATYTGSVETRFSTLATYTGSVDTKFTAVAASTSSLNLFTSSINTTIKTQLNANTVVSGSSQITYSGISGIPAGIISGSGQIVLSSPAQGEARLTINGAAQTSVDLGLQTSDNPTFAGVTAGNITVGITDDNTINTTTGNLVINSAGGTTTIDDNVIVSGDLTVNGTTTYLNVQDLYVEDRFILLASGSATSGDGGIIIDRGSDANSNIAFGFDSVTDRFGFQNGLIDTSNAMDLAQTNGTAAFAGLVFTEGAHGATRPTTGEFAKEGAIYTANSGDIWIYS